MPELLDTDSSDCDESDSEAEAFAGQRIRQKQSVPDYSKSPGRDYKPPPLPKAKPLPKEKPATKKKRKVAKIGLDVNFYVLSGPLWTFGS